MARESPPINADVLRWAVHESGLSLEELATRLKLAPEVVAAWLTGADLPTRGQFTKLTVALRRPASVFFLPAPPDRSSLPDNLRRAAGRTTRELRPVELREVRRARRTQRLVSVLQRESGADQVGLPAVNPRMAPATVGPVLRSWLDVSLDTQREWRTPREAFTAWREAHENRGILVMQCRLGTEGLRGFSFGDAFAPLAGVNTAENLQARIFTLLHEAAHLASRTETACLEGIAATGVGNSLERWCDRVASEVLVPADALRASASAYETRNEEDFETASRVADEFSVSLRAAAVALIRENLAEAGLYADIEHRFPGSDYKKGFGRGVPKRAPQQRLSEIGHRAASLVVDAVAESRLTEREARDYLRLDGAELRELGLELGGAA